MNFLPLPAAICYGKRHNMLHRLSVVLLFCLLLAGVARAETPTLTLHLPNDQTVSGEIITMTDAGIVLKMADGKYSERIPWGKLSQPDIRELLQNPKAAAFVEPFVEVSQAEKLKKTEVEVKDFPKMHRPTGHSLIGAMFTSAIGIFTLLLLYAANLYAAYEISIYRAQPTGLVCGVSAVAPLVGPIIFISMPTKIKKKQAEWQPPPEEIAADNIAEAALAAEQAATNTAAQAAQPAAPAHPPAKVFARGQYTFNRRFFETQMPGFFAMVRPESEKDTVMTFKSTRGTFVVQRISRISASDITLQVHQGNAFEDVIIPFVEIQEVQLKHKDA
jgi:hypothetical protein